MRLKDITGCRFGRLVVTHRVGTNRNKKVTWSCVCDCGNTIVAATTSLNSGNTKSCGCYNIDKIIERNTKHGKAKTKEYEAWQHMKHRCLNPKDSRYARYGGRGITVCDRWLESFENFFADMGESPSPSHSIDRIDNSLGYFKDNCRWVVNTIQSRNRRTNHMLTYDGRTQCMAEWADEFNIELRTLHARITTCGWSVEKAITTPVRK